MTRSNDQRTAFSLMHLLSNLPRLVFVVLSCLQAKAADVSKELYCDWVRKQWLESCNSKTWCENTLQNFYNRAPHCSTSNSSSSLSRMPHLHICVIGQLTVVRLMNLEFHVLCTEPKNPGSEHLKRTSHFIIFSWDCEPFWGANYAGFSCLLGFHPGIEQLWMHSSGTSSRPRDASSCLASKQLHARSVCSKICPICGFAKQTWNPVANLNEP